jgi:PKD repeat protein
MKHLFLFFFCCLIGMSSVFAQANKANSTWAENSDLSLTKAEIKRIDRLFGKKGEVYFTFKIKDRSEISTLTKVVSIDGVTDGVVTAIANKKQFAAFLRLHYAYKIQRNPNELENVKTVDAKRFSQLLRQAKGSSTPNTVTAIWDAYPTYPAYETIMQQFATAYPNICKLVTIATLPSGRKILGLKISDNINVKEDEPAFLYSSSMHGDEIAGYVGMLHYIDYLLTNYGTDARVTYMVNNMEIWINPSANPDGTYAGGNTTVNGATRANANNIDLNRNYPDFQDGAHPDGNAYQPETVAFMALADTVDFVMAANFHGGAEVVNYPWDTKAPLHADNNWWIRESRKYADTVRAHSPAAYMTGVTANGITNGFAWYEVNGGRQDYMNYYKHCREFTVELSSTKILQPANLLNNWEYNYRSWLTYMEETLHGLRGTITDACTNQPIRAKVTIVNHDAEGSEVYSNKTFGRYNRPIFAGTYSVTYSAPGYVSQTFNNITITDGAATIQNVSLSPAPPQVSFTTASTQVCGSDVAFTDATGSGISWKWSFGDGSFSTVQNPTHTYAASGTYTVKLVVQNCAGRDSLTQNNFVTVTVVERPFVVNGSTCTGSAANLSASANNTLNWYTSASATTPIYIGTNFTTPLLTATTTYYVENEQIGATQHIGAAGSAIGAGGFFTAATYHYLRFTAQTAFKLMSVSVNANTAGNRTIQLRNSAGTVLQSATVNIPAGVSRVTLNFSVPIGTDLQLGVAGANNLYRNSAGAAFPYNLAGIASITGNSANNTTSYYYFYDWEVAKTCGSGRVPATATIYPLTPTPVVTNTNGVLSANVSGTNTNQWYSTTTGSIAGATDATFSPTVSGSYYLITTAAHGCASLQSNTINVIITGIENTLANQKTVAVYPNPAHDFTTIDLSAFANTQKTISVYNVLGAMISTTNTTEKTYRLNTENLPKGSYILKITAGQEEGSAKVSVE